MYEYLQNNTHIHVKHEPRKFTIEFTTSTNPAVVELDFKKIKKFIEENVGNITEETKICAN